MSYTEKETQQMIARALDNYESSHADFHAVIEDLGKNFENFKAAYDKKLYKIETVLGRGLLPGGGSASRRGRTTITDTRPATRRGSRGLRRRN